MKWWVWAIVFVLVASGVFWLYMFLTADKRENAEQLENARAEKERKRLEEIEKERLSVGAKINGVTTGTEVKTEVKKGTKPAKKNAGVT